VRRDLGLVRSILLSIRDHGTIGFHPDEGDNAIAFHKNMLINAKFIQPVWGDCAESPFELTWDGHEVLDGLGNDVEWDAVKEICKSLGCKAEHCSWEFASSVVQEVRATG